MHTMEMVALMPASCHQVGTLLKQPLLPIWVVCSESHFSVLFSTDDEVRGHVAAEQKRAEETRWSLQISKRCSDALRRTAAGISSPLEECSEMVVTTVGDGAAELGG